MCNMKSNEFKLVQSTLDLTNWQMAEMLCCSLSAVCSYRSEGVRKRNIPPLVEKVLIDAYLKSGGRLEDLKAE